MIFKMRRRKNSKRLRGYRYFLIYSFIFFRIPLTIQIDLAAYAYYSDIHGFRLHIYFLLLTLTHEYSDSSEVVSDVF